MSEAPKVTDLYGDLSPREAAARHEEYLGALTKSNSNPIDAGSMIQGSPMAAVAPQSPSAAIEAVLGNESMVKSMAPDALASLNSALESQRAIGADIVKDLTLTSPISTGLVAFDLEAPAKLLTPRPTPLRNKIPRKKGVGTSHRIKVISGYTGTGTGGVGNTWPGITDSTTTTFGSINYLRGPKITYAGYDKAVNYKQFSLSDAVPFSAQFQGQGYQDIRQLSQTSTLYASMLMEERMLLMSRGTDSGFSGALSAPTFALTSPVASGQTALAANTYYVNVTADAGAFGESILGTEASTAVASGDVLQIDITPVAGALGYNIYVGTATGAANLKYQGRSTGTKFVVQGAASIVTVGDTAPFTTTGAAATRAAADTSAYATGYDGILPTVLGSESGKINRINSTFSTSNPGSEFQVVFSALYDAVKADPDEVLLNGADRKQLSDAIKSGSTANYRLNISQDEIGGVVLGNIVTGLQNEVTGKGVALTVHPWLPQGVAPVLSYTLPIPDTNVSDVWAVFNTQDYMAIEWPVTQFAYETSTYWNGTFQCQAPAWNGVVSGIVSA